MAARRCIPRPPAAVVASRYYMVPWVVLVFGLCPFVHSLAAAAAQLQWRRRAVATRGDQPQLALARPATSLKPRYVGHTINLCSQKTTWSPFRQSNNQPTVWSSRFLGQWKTCCLLAIGFLPPSPLLWPSYHRSSQTCALIRRVLSLWPFSNEFQWNLQLKSNSIKI